MVVKKRNLSELIMHITWICWIFFVITFSDSITKYANICALIMMTISFVFILKKHNLYFSRELQMMTLFGIFVTFSIMWSYDKSISQYRIISTWRMIIMLILITNYVQHTNDSNFLFYGIEIAGNLVAIYTILHYGINGLRTLLSTGNIRVGGDFVNENTLGIFLIVSTIISLYQIIHNQNIKRTLLMVLPLIVSLMSGSRKVILIVCVAFAYILLRELFTDKKKFGKIRIFLIMFIVLVAFWYLYNSPIGETLRLRIISMFGQTTKMDQSMVNRVNMVSIGLEQFYQTPLFGIGIGSSSVLTGGTYLHNNYIELLATTGICGFILYYSFYFLCLFRLLRIDSDGQRDIALLLLIVCFVTDFASVSYYSKTQYMLFIVITATIAILRQTERRNYNE